MTAHASLAAYREALTTPGSLRPVLSSLLARLPVAMVAFSVLLYVQRATGSFATAGVVAAGTLIGNTIGAVGQGRLADRFGPTRPLLIAAALFTVAITGLILAVEGRAATAAVVAIATVVGLTEPMVPSASRALWARLLPPGPAREAAFAYEAISMEVFFIIGPAFAGLMIAMPWAGLGVVIGAVCMVVGSVAFALSPVVRAWRVSERATARPLLGALVSPGMQTLVIASAGFGVVIGFVEVAVPAAATAVGQPTTGGLLLSVWSLSSVLFGLAYSLRPRPRDIRLRLPVLLALFGGLVGLVALPTALAPASMLLLGCALVLAGSMITPQATTHSSVIELVAPRGTATEAFGWVITAVTVGLSIGQPLSGLLVEEVGPPASFAAATVFGLAFAAVVYLRRSTVSATQVVQLGPDAELGRTPQHRIDVGVDQLDDLARAGVRP